MEALMMYKSAPVIMLPAAALGLAETIGPRHCGWSLHHLNPFNQPALVFSPQITLL